MPALTRSDILQGTTSTHSSTSSFRARASETKYRFQAFFRSLCHVDYSKLQLVPALRTAIILMSEWLLLGIGNDTSTTFQITCIFVGMSDPQGPFSRRLHLMGLIVIATTLFGSVLPSMVWASPAATLTASFLVALANGYSPAMDSAALFQAMKWGCVLFAINCGINRSIDGYGDVWTPMLYTFCGGLSYFIVASIPEIVGNREGMRTQLFRVWFGFGMNLYKWNEHWATAAHFSRAPAPNTTMSITKLREIISKDTTEDPVSKEWLSSILERANTIRMSCICLSNAYRLTEDLLNTTQREAVILLDKKDVNGLFVAVGCACRRIAFALKFPWITRYVPFIRDRLEYAEQWVAEAALDLKKAPASGLGWLPAIVDLLHSEIKSMVHTIRDVDTWPKYAPVKEVHKRAMAAFPATLRKPQPDPECVFLSYAFRFGLVFCLANIPGLFLSERPGAYWFPMTVGLIMTPTEGATYQKVAHRTIGTLLGICLGAALYPLLQYRPILILMVGITAIGAVVFHFANYAIFTFFITGWVFCVTVGVGVPLGDVVAYRVLWTLSAAALVCLATYLAPTKRKYEVTDLVINMAKATKIYAEEITEFRRLLREAEELGMANPEMVKEANNKLCDIRLTVTKARVAMLKGIHEASFTPTEGYLVDPHSVAPILASNLIGAAIIPKLVSLVPDSSVEALLLDVDANSLGEIDRLIRRLEAHPTTSVLPADDTTNVIELTAPGRGPFSHAIALAHRRLDEARVPRDAKQK